MSDFGIDYGQDTSNTTIGDSGGGPVPNGAYHTVVASAEYKPNAQGKNPRISIGHQIADGPFKNRRFWHDFYVNGENAPGEKAKFAAFSRLHGLEVKNIAELTQLIGKQQMAKIDIKKGTNGYPDRNRVLDVKPLGSPATTPAAAATDDRDGW